MKYEELLRQLREHYPDASWKSNIDLLYWAEDRLLQLNQVPKEELTKLELQRLALLPFVLEFLQ